MIYLYNGILFGDKKGIKSTCHNTDEPQKIMLSEINHSKDHILYNSIYIKCPDWACLQTESGLVIEVRMRAGWGKNEK